MESSTLFRQVRMLYTGLATALDHLKARPRYSEVQQWEACLKESSMAMRELESLITGHEFSALEDEIHFFRDLKPPFTAEHLYYSRVLALEKNRPESSPESAMTYYRQEVAGLQAFRDEHAEFCTYLRRKATFMDHTYFVRSYGEGVSYSRGRMTGSGTGFSSSHDGLVAELLTVERLEQHLLNRVLETLEAIRTLEAKRPVLTWTGPRSSLVELIYALYLAECLNNGEPTLSATVKMVTGSFNIELENFQKTLLEISSRKTGRAKFIQSLLDRLEARFEEPDW